MIHEQARMLELMAELLGPERVRLSVVSYDLHEDFAREDTQITCTIRWVDGPTAVIEGHGVGPIDAFFNGLLGRLSKDHPSLNSLVIDKFQVLGKLSAGTRKSQSDGLAHAIVGIRNPRGSQFEFESESRSVTRSGIDATLRAAEYFVNSELAFIKAYKSLQHAREQKRQDLVARYTDLMSQLVRNTTYSEVIEQIRADVEGQR